MPPARLYILPPSHYCERASWALDFIGQDYQKIPFPVGLHAPLSRRIAGGTSLPIYDTGTAILQGSDRILDWTGIGQGDPELEARFERKIGPLIRQFIYSSMLNDPKSGIRDILFDGVTGWQRIVGTLMWPVTRKMMIKGMSAYSSITEELSTKLDAELSWFEIRLEGKPYLVGNAFGRADITAASLLAPLARPPHCPLYSQGKLSARLEQRLTTWRTRPALQWVLKTYLEQRDRRNT